MVSVITNMIKTYGDRESDGLTDRRMERQTDRQTQDVIYQQTDLPESRECDIRWRVCLAAPQPCLPLGSEVDNHGRQTRVLVKIPEVRNCLLLLLLLFRRLNLNLRGATNVFILSPQSQLTGSN